MGFDAAAIGKWSDEKEFKVDAERTIAYAAATNDDNPVLRTGEVAPPVFAVAPAMEVMSDVMPAIVPSEYAMMVLHGEQDMYFHRPIVPGGVVRTKAAATGLIVKRSGTSLVIRTETRDGDGELLVEQIWNLFFRGASEGESAGEGPPAHKFPEELRDSEPVATVSQRFDEDQTFRYADASGDHMPIHKDEDIARSVGLPGIIIHGLCTMAFTSRAVVGSVAGDDPRKLKRLAVRFSKPVLPGEEVTTRIWEHGERDGRRMYVFETTNADGAAVIKDGLAEVEA